MQSLSISFIYDSINLVNVPSELITTGTMVHFFSFHGPTTSHSNFSVNNSFLTFPFPQSWFQTGKKSIDYDILVIWFICIMAVSCFSHHMGLHLQSGDQGREQRSQVKCQMDQNHILVRSKARKNVCSIFRLTYKFKMTES